MVRVSEPFGYLLVRLIVIELLLMDHLGLLSLILLMIIVLYVTELLVHGSLGCIWPHLLKLVVSQSWSLWPSEDNVRVFKILVLFI